MKLKLFAMGTLATVVLLFNMAVHADDSALMEPVKSVLDQYLMIQTNLANDSIQGLDARATAIAAAIKCGDMKMLSADVANQAEKLAKSMDLKGAREAFKPLSASLIKYLADNKAGIGTYHEAFCPMAKASWLQVGKDLRNPYLGREMPTCGEIKS